MSQKMFTGVGVALPTLFTDEDMVDCDSLGLLIDKMLSVSPSVDFLVPCGTTGESPTLNFAEHKGVVDFVVRSARGRALVLAGTGSNNTKEAIALTEEALESGADGCLSIAPYYNKPMSDGYLNHFREIAKVGLPIMLYDIPGRTAKSVPIEVIKDLALEGSIFGVKWASGDFDQLMELRQSLPKDFVILSGDDGLTFPAMALGAQGVISVAANIVPSELKLMCDAILGGDLETARGLHYDLLPLFRSLFIETNPIPLKEALALIFPKFCRPNLRSPLCRMKKEKYEILSNALLKHHLIMGS